MAVESAPAPPRIAVASIIQESNTFSPQPSTLADFEAQGLWLGAEAAELSQGTNTEFAGAMEVLADGGVEAVPLVRAWAMSSGTLTRGAFSALRDLLADSLTAAGALDGLVLCLHGALAAENEPDADGALAELARSLLGPGVPLVVTHDLHANLTQRIVAAVSSLVGFRTYPHIDQGDTGRRAATLMLREIRGEAPARTVLAKRPMIVPPEAQYLAEPPMATIRALADGTLGGEILDISLFPVQPWLDVPELGFGVTVTSAGDPGDAARLAERIAEAAWRARAAFQIALHDVAEVVSRIPRGAASGPVLLVQSADSPTSGATADSATVIAALIKHGRGLRAYATVVDTPAVTACHDAGTGGRVATTLGATLDSRWSKPVPVSGRVLRTGDTPVLLAGAAMTGQEISMGRWATMETGDGLVVLVTERPAPTFDPSAYRHVGLEPGGADAVLVRSATLYRAGFAGLASSAYVLDLPGASTPKFDYLNFRHAPRPLYPLTHGVQATSQGTRASQSPVAAPIRVGANFVPVYYAGGHNIEEFRGEHGGVIGPEDWVGSLSALPAVLLKEGAPLDTGISRTEHGSLRDLIAADPVAWLGQRLADAFDGHTGLLVKLLDAGERLPVHCHPSRDFARRHLGSLFGKTEGWIVMRSEPGSRVWIGMRDAVDPADMRQWIAAGDAASMLGAMNEVLVRPGQVLYVPAGLPHAIGPGVMVTELQEPTSFSVLADHEAFGVGPGAATLGLGWDLALSCFDLAAYRNRLGELLPQPRVLQGAGTADSKGRLHDLFPSDAATFFRAWHAESISGLTFPEASFAIVIATEGHGRLEWEGDSADIRRGQTLVVPACSGPLRLAGQVSAIVCLPPQV